MRVHQFLFRGGVFLGIPFIGIGAGRYNFADMVSNDSPGAVAIHPWIDVICTHAFVTIPPYQDPQLVLYIVKVRVGAAYMELLYDVPEEDCDDGWETIRAASRGATPPDATRTEDVATASTTQSLEGDCDEGGGYVPGGGEPEEYTGSGGTKICLWIDRYDGDGNLLYSVLDSCWVEYAT